MWKTQGRTEASKANTATLLCVKARVCWLQCWFWTITTLLLSFCLFTSRRSVLAFYTFDGEGWLYKVFSARVWTASCKYSCVNEALLNATHWALRSTAGVGQTPPLPSLCPVGNDYSPSACPKTLRDGTPNRCLNQIVFHYIQKQYCYPGVWRKPFGQRLLPWIICIMDLSAVINRPCSYSRFLLSFLSSALRWIMALCATCRWAALLWLPYGHQILHIYCPWIMARWKPSAAHFLPSSPLFFTLSPSFGLLLSLILRPLSRPVFFSLSLVFSPRLDLAPCIPSCLIKVCIINTATSLSILLRCSYDCYIKFKLFRCNSLLMSLL